MNSEVTIVYHLGALNTDNDQLTWSIRKNNELMQKHGVLMRRPKEYRPHLRNMLTELAGEQPSEVDQESLMHALIKAQKPKRLLLSNSKFMADPAWIFQNGVFYHNAPANTAALRNLFPHNPTEFFLGIANPASFIPAAFKSQKNKDYAAFMGNTDLANVRWSDVIARIQDANPDCPITVWCNEDSPIIWPTILRRVAGVDPKTKLEGENDIINNIISEEGQTLLAKYLADRPNLTEAQRQRLRVVFLERFYLNEAVEEVIDLPGWTDETIDALTKIYDDDVDRIKQMDDVTFLSL